MSTARPGQVPGPFSAAFEEARALGDGWVGTEHFLLALLARPSVASVDSEDGIDLDGIVAEVEGGDRPVG